MIKKRKICFITGSRAEYGMQYFLLKDIKSYKNIKLNIIITGSHLSKQFGYTYKEILNDNFKNNFKIKIFSSRKSEVANAAAKAIDKISKKIKKIKPDIVVIVGDRYEMFSAAFASLVNRIPIAHIHGGETTYGAFDDALRHSITKMSTWHFVANPIYKKRVIQLGENPQNVFITGGLGVDAIKKSKIISRKDLEKKYKFTFNKKNLLITYHTETLSKSYGLKGLKNLLKVLSELKNTNFFFTMPNSDTGNEKIEKMIKKFKRSRKKFTVITPSFGRVIYFSLLKNVDAVIGNSSSGLLEVPSFKIPTINIGDRQAGRVKAQSVIDCSDDIASIARSIAKIYKKNFIKKISNCKNPYDYGNTSKNILKILSKKKLPNSTKKTFFDLK